MKFTERWTLAFLEWLQIVSIKQELAEIKKTLNRQELQTATGQALLVNQQKALEEQICELRELLTITVTNNSQGQKLAGVTEAHHAEKTSA